MSTCPACGVPARAVYPSGFYDAAKWEAHPCGCVIPQQLAEHLLATLTRQAGAGRLRGPGATLTASQLEDGYAPTRATGTPRAAEPS